MNRIALLLGLALAVSAPQCGGDAVDVMLTFEPAAITVPASSYFTVDVVVRTNGSTSVQAWELEVEGDFPTAVPLGASPHPQFDDDGVLSLPVQLDLESAGMARIVDVRHGVAASGTFRAVTLGIVAGAPGQTTLRVVGGGLAGPAGNQLSSSLGVANITVQ